MLKRLKVLRQWRRVPEWVASTLERLFWPHSWSEWRTLVSGVCVACLGAAGFHWYSRAEWASQWELLQHEQVRTISDLEEDLASAQEELSVTQNQNDLLAARRQLELAFRALESRQAEEAQLRLTQAAVFLKAANPRFSGVDVRRLLRLRNQLSSLELRDTSGLEQLKELAGELDTLIGE